MAYDEAIRSISLDADSSIAVYTGVPGLPGSADPNGGKQYRFVKVTGAGTVGLATAAANASLTSTSRTDKLKPASSSDSRPSRRT